MNNTYYLDTFSKTVDDFVNSKFLLVEGKLSKFLSGIAKNKLLYSLIESCLKDFDFEGEFKKATKDETFTLPSRAEKIVAFVFCLLVEADNKKLDFYKFLQLYFNSKDVQSSFTSFNEQVIIPFKNCVFVLCGEGAQENAEPEVKEPTLDELFLPYAESLVNTASLYKKCENVRPIVYAMVESLKGQNAELFHALKVALLTNKNRKFVKEATAILNRFSATYQA